MCKLVRKIFPIHQPLQLHKLVEIKAAWTWWVSKFLGRVLSVVKYILKYELVTPKLTHNLFL